MFPLAKGWRGADVDIVVGAVSAVGLICGKIVLTPNFHSNFFKTKGGKLSANPQTTLGIVEKLKNIMVRLFADGLTYRILLNTHVCIRTRCRTDCHCLHTLRKQMFRNSPFCDCKTICVQSSDILLNLVVVRIYFELNFWFPLLKVPE